MWAAISFTADLLPKKWFWNLSRCESTERVFFGFTRNERRPLIWEPSDKDRELVFPLSRHSSVFMSDYGLSINRKVKNIHFCIKTLVEVKDFFSFLKEIISSSFQAKDIKCMVWFRLYVATLLKQLTLSNSVLFSGPQCTLPIKRRGWTSETFLQGRTVVLRLWGSESERTADDRWRRAQSFQLSWDVMRFTDQRFMLGGT